MKLLLLFIIVLPVIFSVMAVKANKIKATDLSDRISDLVTVDSEKALTHLKELIKYPTVSDADYEKTDKALFIKYKEEFRKMYPVVNSKAEYSEHGNTSMLFKIKGKSNKKPVVLMSHYDVVPVAEERWDHPPFCAEIIDGELWGRGTLDTKITGVGIMEAMESLLNKGFVPANDIYLEFSGDEEVSGISAGKVVDYFEENGIKPWMVLDEGGAVADGVFPGITKPVAVIGIGEKGTCHIKLTSTGAGGHSSTPSQHTSLGRLAKSIVNIEEHPMKAELTAPVEGLFKAVGPYATFPLRLVIANLSLFKNVLPKLGWKLGNEVNAMMRTTTRATMASGSKQQNVIPNEAVAHINARLLNNMTPEELLAAIQAQCVDGVVAEYVTMNEASPYASTESDAWNLLTRAVGDTWTDSIVAPYLMVAGSDSKVFSRICRDVYKFSAWHVSTELRGTIHNDNERIPVSEIGKTVEFFTRLISTL